jgi:hypothetical protein
MLLSRNADPDMVPPLSPMYNAIIARKEPIILKLLKYGARAHNLHAAAIITMKRLTPACRNLLRAWPLQHYEQYVKTLRRASSDGSQKEAALLSTLSCANEHGHKEVHSLFMELAIEFGILVGEEYSFTSGAEQAT